MKAASSSNHHVSARILLIDDNSHGLLARKSVLEELGYHITTAGSASEGLDQLAKGEFELVVTDYKMPQMNGVQFIQELRNRELVIPVILLSGFAEALGLDEKNTGADAVIQKSANEVSLMLRSVTRLLRRKPAQRAAPPDLRKAKAKSAGR